MTPREIIIKPAVTEKNNNIRTNERKNCYVFQVHPQANKMQIREAVQKIWNVTVEQVNTANVPGKFKRHGRSQGYRPDWKKAFVKLAAGNKIDIFEK